MLHSIHKINIIALILVLLCSLGLLFGCNEIDDTQMGLKMDNIETAVVHDPSIFYDEVTKKYYAFGSHFAVASSKDLVNWHQEIYEYQPEKLFGTKDFRSILIKSDEFNGREGGINSIWAPDVIKYGDKYYMYYALTTAFGKGKSCIGRVSSDKVLGPYSNEEVLIYSHDLWWEEPNAIDPELFYDKNGKLWMVYGSYFAGIYIKELNNAGDKFGLPIDDSFGKKICWDGYSSGVEGPFIFYNQNTDYYYLIVSEGNLTSNYNMRVARSKNPDGPYLDINGFDMLTPEGKGNKLSGNYRFYPEDKGHVALGHNSVIKMDDEFFCIYHERTSWNGRIVQSYNIKTRKLIFDNEGWPYLSPNEYRGEQTKEIKRSEIIGSYDIVIHSKETIDDIMVSERYIFSPTGAIFKNGIKVGKYSFDSNNIIFYLNEKKYKGIVTENYVEYLNKVTISISAMSDDYTPVFANLVYA